MSVGPDDVQDKIAFARTRLDNLIALGDLPSASGELREQLLQEFFFHLVGATEVLAHVVNERRNLGVAPEDVAVRKIAKKLPPGDLVRAPLDSLYQKTRHRPLPHDPYSDEGYVFRLLVYRNYIAHSGRAGLFLRIGGSPPASFYIDPRNRPQESLRSVQDEAQYMLRLVENRAQAAIAAL